MIKDHTSSMPVNHVICVLMMGFLSAGAFLITDLLPDTVGTALQFLSLFNGRLRGMQMPLLASWLGMSGLYAFWMTHVRQKVSAGAAVLAVLFSLLTTVYASMQDVNTFRRPALLAFLLHLAGYAVCCYVLLTALFSYFDRPLKQNGEDGPISGKKLFFQACGVLLLLWLPYVIMCFPGNAMYDTGISVLYSLGIDRSNVNNPFFQTFLYGLVYQLGVWLGNVNIGVFIYCMVQTLLFAAIFSYGVVLLKTMGAPSWLRICTLLLYGLLPVFPLYALTMGKDSNFALCLLCFSILLLQLVTGDGKFFSDTKKVCGLILTSILLGLLRNQAYLIAVVCLLAVSLTRAGRPGRKQLWLLIVSVLVVNLTLPWVLQIPKTDVSESWSVPLQQTAYYANRYENEITEEDRAAIDKVVPYEALYSYNPGISDPVKDQFDDSADAEAIRGYFSVWWKHFLTHPAAYLKAFWLNSYAYYCPSAERSDIRSRVHLGYRMSSALFEQTEFEPNTNPELSSAAAMDAFITRLPVMGLLQKIGIYTWAMLTAAVYLLSRKQYSYLISMCPMLFVFIGDCFSPVNGYFRYAFPMIVCVPIICLGVIFAAKKQAGNDIADIVSCCDVKV